MNNLKNFLFTSESVSEGHPDKVSDRISDMVVDTFLSGDPFSRVACETLTTTNKVVLAGEVRGPDIKQDDLINKVRDCIKDIGYDQEGFTWRRLTVWINGERKGVMIQPGTTYDMPHYGHHGKPVARLKGPLRWAVDACGGATIEIRRGPFPTSTA